MKLAINVTFFIAGLLCAWPEARAQSDGKLDFANYEKINALASDLFKSFYKESGAAIRASIILETCSQNGLAKAVRATIKDREFAKALEGFAQQGKFRGLPSYSLWETQAVANGLVAGYENGFREAVRLIAVPKNKDAVCKAGVMMADKLLN